MSNFDWETMRQWGGSVGKEGMAKTAIEAVQEFDGSYIGAMILAGRMKAIAQAAGCDDYWSEKVSIGYYKQLRRAEIKLHSGKPQDAQEEANG